MKNPTRVCLGVILLSITIAMWGCGSTAGSSESGSQKDSPASSSLKGVAPEVDTATLIESDTQVPSPYDEGSFVNDQQAWIAGFYVKVTRDGGSTWHQLSPTQESQSVFGKAGYTYTKPYFINPGDGWLRSSTGVWQTQDNGKTWKRIFPKGSGIPRFGDARHGWISVAVSEASQQSYVTTDGGRSWRVCGSERSYNVDSPTDVAHFVSANVGWTITKRTLDNRTVYGVASTSDSGCTWQQLWNNDDDPDETYSDIYFLNEHEGWLSGKANGSLYRTTDGGKTWKPMSLPAKHMKVMNVYFKDSNEGWILVKRMTRDDEEGMYYTRDGGKTWSKLTESDLDTNSSSSKPLPKQWNAGQLFQMLHTSALKRKELNPGTSPLAR